MPQTRQCRSSFPYRIAVWGVSYYIIKKWLLSTVKRRNLIGFELRFAFDREREIGRRGKAPYCPENADTFSIRFAQILRWRKRDSCRSHKAFGFMAYCPENAIAFSISLLSGPPPKIKDSHKDCPLFLAEKERFELSRRFPDLHP